MTKYDRLATAMQQAEVSKDYEPVFVILVNEFISNSVEKNEEITKDIFSKTPEELIKLWEKISEYEDHVVVFLSVRVILYVHKNGDRPGCVIERSDSFMRVTTIIKQILGWES